MKKIFITLSLALLLNSAAFALDEEAKKEAANLLDIMDMDTVMTESIHQMLEVQLQQEPAMKPYKAVMLEFFAKHMSYESLKPQMIEIYAESFTAEELKEISKFYLTPVGKKVMQAMPELSAKGAQLGMERVQDNLPELEKMIEKEAERLGKENK